MKAQHFLIGALLLGLLLASATDLIQAQGPGPQADDASLAPLGTAFTYQGRLKNASGLVNSTCDFQFSLWNAAGSGSPPTGGTQLGTQTVPNAPVSEGLFTVQLNGSGEFGYAVFRGDARWLQIAVRCPAGTGTYTTLSPRQPVTLVPYAQALIPGSVIQNHNDSSGWTPGIWLESDNGTGVVGLAYSAAGVGVVGDNRGGGTGVQGVSGSGYGVHARSTSNAALYAEGPIKSSSRSYVWISGNDLLGASSGEVIEATRGAARLTLPYEGSYGLFLPITVPGVLYGQNVTVESVRLYYQVVGDVVLQGCWLEKWSPSTGTWLMMGFDPDWHDSTTPAYVDIITTQDKTLSADSGILSLSFGLHYAGEAYIYGARLELSHQ